MTRPFDDPSLREDDETGSDRFQRTVAGVREELVELEVELADVEFSKTQTPWWMVKQ